jgi:hypothetical protein
MPSQREWAEGYLEQARADLAAARVLGGREPSAFAMLLQMCFEKLAKAALLRKGSVDVAWARSNHRAAGLMVKTMRLQRTLLSPLGGITVWEDALRVVEALENAHPSVATDGPHLEYPWANTDGRVSWPAKDLSIAQRLANPKSNLAPRVLSFASQLSDKFDQIFP